MQKNFHVYKSSAGSGKTYTLVKEYLKLVLLDPSRVRQILAITFTNAAAAEMKERIIQAVSEIARLGERTGGKTDRLLDEVIKELGANEPLNVPGRDTMIRHANEVLKRILHHYADFSVSTIDSFVHRVIRTFAFDLRIPFHFEVELDADSLLRQAVDLLISRVGEDRELTEVLIAYMMTQADDEQDTRIEEKIAKMARTLTDEESILFIERLKETPLQDFRKLATRLRDSVRRFESTIQREALAAQKLIRDAGIPASAFYRGKSGIASYFDRLVTGPVHERIEANSYVWATVDEDRWTSGKCSIEQEAAIMGIRERLLDHFHRIQQTVESNMPQYLCEKALMRTIYPLAVLNEVEKMLEEIKAENVILPISDFNKRIAAIVSRQPVPFIYERLGERYKHYMIDEFQDTSLLQWQNLLPLVENALSEGQVSLVVGDGKQAIYRFRNGDVEQFARLPYLTEGIRAMARPEWEITLENNYAYKNLETNWRSAKAVVEFNNRFFRFAKEALSEELRDIYKESCQKVAGDKPEGLVHIRFLEAGNRQEVAREMMRHITECIRTCLDAGHPLGDITILCRKNSEASMVARELLEQQIPVISQESLLLNQSDEVNFFLAIIRLLANPRDGIAALEMLSFLHKDGRLGEGHSLHECLHSAGLYRHSGKHQSLHGGLEELLKSHGIDFRFAHFDHLNIYDSCETILRLFFSGGRTPNAFVAFFMDAVFDFSEKHKLSHADFIEWWEEKGHNYSIIVPEGLEAVQVMTVHKSKGLQFPVVIHPFAYQRPDRLTKDGLWTDGERSGIPDIPAQWLEMSQRSLAGTVFEKDLTREQEKTFLDLLNATYVAFTRPSEKLFILTQKEAKEYKRQSVNGLLHDFLQHESLWEEGQDSYSFGEAGTVRKGKGTPVSEEQTMQYLPSRSWSHALRMRSHQRERSMLLGDEDPMERGNLLHRALEEIREIGEVDRVLGQLQERGEIDATASKEWSAKIHQMLANPSLARYFSPGVRVKTEAGIFDEDGSFYRPDRIVFAGEECAIIDYKSGKQYQRHEAQMNTYAAVLEKMGHRQVKKILLYVDEGVVREWGGLQNSV